MAKTAFILEPTPLTSLNSTPFHHLPTHLDFHPSFWSSRLLSAPLLPARLVIYPSSWSSVRPSLKNLNTIVWGLPVGTGVLPTPCNPTCSKNIFGITLQNPENNSIYKSECNTGLGGTVTPSLVGFV